MIECSPEFACRSSAIARLGRSHCQVEMVVGIARVILNRALEIIGRTFLPATLSHNSEVVVNLGKWQTLGDELKGGFSFGEISVSVGGESQIEVCLASNGAGGRGNSRLSGRLVHLTERGNCRFVSMLRVVGFAKREPCLRVIGIEPRRIPIALDFFIGGRRQRAANIVL